MTKFGSSVLIGLLLASGASARDRAERGLESVHQPVVARSDYVFDVNAGGNGLGEGEASRLAAWFRSMGLGYGDRVSIDSSEGYGDYGARNTVAAMVARFGLLLDDTAPVTKGEIAPGAVRVIISRMAASVPGCPNWGGGLEEQINERQLPNYGCAVNSNLAAMVANPEDLVSGQVGGPTSSVSAGSKAIKTYQEAPNTGKNGIKSEGTK